MAVLQDSLVEVPKGLRYPDTTASVTTCVSMSYSTWDITLVQSFNKTFDHMPPYELLESCQGTFMASWFFFSQWTCVGPHNFECSNSGKIFWTLKVRFYSCGLIGSIRVGSVLKLPLVSKSKVVPHLTNIMGLILCLCCQLRHAFDRNL